MQARVLHRKFTQRGDGARSLIKAPDHLPPTIKAVFEGGIAALDHYRPHYYPGKVSYLTCGYHSYVPHGPAAVWPTLVGQLEVQSVPIDQLLTPTHPEYVAKWVFERIQDAVGQDVRPRSVF